MKISLIAAYIAAALIGYLFGSSNMALYLSKWKGVDLRQTGSRNLGTCNTYLTFGLPYAVLVFVHDAGKAAAAILLARWLFPEVSCIGFAAGSAAVIGHIYPFYLHFHGGKGFASFLGAALMMNWRFALLLILAVALITVATNYIAIGTAVTVLSFPVIIGLTTRSALAVIFVLLDTVIILWKHRENFVHIARGTEIGLRKKA